MALIWGIPYLFIKIAVAEITPATLVFLRSVIGASLLLPLAVGRNDLAPLRPYWKWMLAYTFVEIAAPWFLLSDAERRISSSLAGLLIAASPSIAAVLALLTGGRDRLDSRRVVGWSLASAGSRLSSVWTCAPTISARLPRSSSSRSAMRAGR